MAIFKVTRTWYVDAKNATDAIVKTKRPDHDEVEANRVETEQVPTPVIERRF